MTRYDQTGGPLRTDVWIPDPWPTSPGQRRSAVRVCASHATDAAQFADYCAALGLDPAEGKT